MTPGFEGPSDLVHGLLALLSFEIKPFSGQGIALPGIFDIHLETKLGYSRNYQFRY